MEVFTVPLRRTTSRGTSPSNTRRSRHSASSSASSSRSSSPMPLPSRMALLSRDKLHKEVASREPNLRRCLGHHHLLRRSVQVVQEDMKHAMVTFHVDDDDEEELSTAPPTSHPAPESVRNQITHAVKAMVKRRTNRSSTSTSTSSEHEHVHAHAHDHAYDQEDQTYSLTRVSSNNTSIHNTNTTSDVTKNKPKPSKTAPPIAASPPSTHHLGFTPTVTTTISASPPRKTSPIARGRRYASRLALNRRMWSPSAHAMRASVAG